MRTRLGMSLLEITIAMSIFMTVTVMVTQSAIGVNQVFDQGMAQDDISFDTDIILREMRADMVRSGWHVPLSQIESSTGKLTTDPALDRKRRYYPYVQFDQHIDGRGEAFDHTAHSVVSVPDFALPGTAYDTIMGLRATNPASYYSSFHASAQGLVFVRANLGSWSMYPWKSGRGEESLNFGGQLKDWKTGNIGTSPPGGKQDDLGILYPSNWVETGSGTNIFSPRFNNQVSGYGVEMTSGVVDNRGELTVAPYWETMSAPTYGYTISGTGPTATTTFTGMGTDDADIREYMYCVLPYESARGWGRLVRGVSVLQPQANFTFGYEVGQYFAINSTATTTKGMVVDKVLSDEVLRVVFDTCRTTKDDPTTTDINEQLGLNQIRVRLFFGRKLPGDGKMITQVVESVISMHAKLGQALVTSDTAVVGTAGIAFPY